MYNLEENKKLLDEIKTIIDKRKYEEYTIENITEIILQLKQLEEDVKSKNIHEEINYAIFILEIELEKQKLYGGIYETETATFNHDVYLYGAPNKTYGTYDSNVKITDKDGNTVNISYKDMCKFIDRIQLEIKENIIERDKILNPQDYEERPHRPDDITHEGPDREWSWPKHDEPAPDLAHCSETALERYLIMWR